MEKFIEKLISMIFGFTKDSTLKIPDINYKNEYLISLYPSKAISKIISSLIILLLSVTLWFVVGDDNKNLLFIFILLGLAFFVFAIGSVSYSCKVNDEKLVEKTFFFFKKTTYWNNITTIVKEKSNRGKCIVISLLDRDGKCLIDFSTEMKNAWYLIKTAQNKKISIKNK